MEKLQLAYQQRAKKRNKIEILKESKNPFDAYKKLAYYAENGYDSIPKEDKEYFLKCFGIYDRAKTPRQFMLKLRIPAGHLTALQAKTIGECAKEFGKDYLDLTTRSQCELRYLDIENLPTIIKRLEKVGIVAYQTGVDNVRGIMGDPFDSDALDNILPSHDILLAMQEKILFNPEYVSALPRKFNTAITGCVTNRCNVFVHDLCFVLANKDGEYGYNVYLGGKVGKVAQNANIFVKNKEEVLACFEAVIRLYKNYGFRDNRNKNRLYFLLESVGIEVFSEAIRKEANIDFATAGITMTQVDYFDPDNAKVRLKDGTYALHMIIPSGMFCGSDMIEAANIATKYGNATLAIDMEQSLYIKGINDIDIVLKEKIFQKYNHFDSVYMNHLIACAGTLHCPYGVIENKNDAINMANFLKKEVPLPNDARVRMYWSGCPKGCGIHGLADIGFEGCKAKYGGKNVSGVHIYLGGSLINEAKEGYTIIKSAPLILAKEYIATLMREYKRLRKTNESFAMFHNRILIQYTPAYIGFMIYFLTYCYKNNIYIENFGIDTIKNTGKIEEFEVFEFGRKLFYALTKEEPFQGGVDRFTPILKQKAKDIWLLRKDIDKNIAIIIEKTLEVEERKKAIVFSELKEYISMS